MEPERLETGRKNVALAHKPFVLCFRQIRIEIIYQSVGYICATQPFNQEIQTLQEIFMPESTDFLWILHY